jgi:hypothetical protein
LLIDPGLITDIVGAVIATVVVSAQLIARRRQLAQQKVPV